MPVHDSSVVGESIIVWHHRLSVSNIQKLELALALFGVSSQGALPRLSGVEHRQHDHKSTSHNHSMEARDVMEAGRSSQQTPPLTSGTSAPLPRTRHCEP